MESDLKALPAHHVILSEAKNPSAWRCIQQEILRFAQNDKKIWVNLLFSDKLPVHPRGRLSPIAQKNDAFFLESHVPDQLKPPGNPRHSHDVPNGGWPFGRKVQGGNRPTTGPGVWMGGCR